MILLRHVLLMILALLVQTSWAHTLEIFGIRPDFVLLLVVYVGIVSGQVEATILGFVSGFLLDVYNPAFMGVNALANAVAVAAKPVHDPELPDALPVKAPMNPVAVIFPVDGL